MGIEPTYIFQSYVIPLRPRLKIKRNLLNINKYSHINKIAVIIETY